MTKKNQIDHTVNVAIIKQLEKVLEQKLIPSKGILTNDNKILISEMLLLYDLDADEIIKAVLWATTEDHLLDIEEFKQACNEVFIRKNKQHNMSKSNVTKEDELISRLESISSKQLLKDLSGGNNASERDMKIISEIMINQGLPEPVMNVLIHYVLLQSNMKLSKSYLEKIASHWSRADLKTAKEAMAYAKKQIEMYQKTKRKPAQPFPKVEQTEEKPFTVFEYRYIEKLNDKYNIDFNVAREVIYYGRKVNNGLMIYWFLDAVSEYIHRHNGSEAEDTKELLNIFHEKFVVDFGKE